MAHYDLRMGAMSTPFDAEPTKRKSMSEYRNSEGNCFGKSKILYTLLNTRAHGQPGAGKMVVVGLVCDSLCTKVLTVISCRRIHLTERLNL